MIFSRQMVSLFFVRVTGIGDWKIWWRLVFNSAFLQLVCNFGSMLQHEADLPIFIYFLSSNFIIETRASSGPANSSKIVMLANISDQPSVSDVKPEPVFLGSENSWSRHSRLPFILLSIRLCSRNRWRWVN